jgi:hypothetical protein
MSTRSSRSPGRPERPSSTRRVFPYRALDADGDENADDSERLLYPVVAIRAHGLTGVRLPMWGLIDSGADEALFPLEVAETLGIDIDDCDDKDCLTAGGLATHYVWKPGLEIEVPEMGGVRMQVSATFSEGLPGTMILLGRRDFFRCFRVSFDERANNFSLEEYERA